MRLPIDYDTATPAEKKAAREEYANRQDGNCWYCKSDLGEPPTPEICRAYIDKSRFPPQFFTYKVHLHHDRVTGESLGAVHARCNAYLWQYLGQ